MVFTKSTSSLANLTIEQLESMLASRRKSRLDELKAKHAALSAELRAVESELASAGGAASSVAPAKRRGRPPGKRGPGRPKGSVNKKPGRPGRPPSDGSGGGSMKSAILEELAAAKGADVAVADLIDKLKSRTSSAKPGTIVSLALMALKKSGLVVSAGRGLYKLTPKGLKNA